MKTIVITDETGKVSFRATFADDLEEPVLRALREQLRSGSYQLATARTLQSQANKIRAEQRKLCVIEHDPGDHDA